MDNINKLFVGNVIFDLINSKTWKFQNFLSISSLLPRTGTTPKNLQNVGFYFFAFIEFVIDGFPRNIDALIDPSVRNLIVVDDLMTECMQDSKMCALFTRGSHH